MSKTFKKLGKSKLTGALLAAAAAYFLGDLFGGDGETPTLDPSLVTEPPGSDITMPEVESNLISEPPPEPSPVPETPVPAPQTATPAVAPTGLSQPTLGSSDGGILAGVGRWFKDLSPEGQRVVAQSIAGGAAGLIQGLAQKNAMEDAREREERQRADRERRGRVAAFAPGAIIGPRMG